MNHYREPVDPHAPDPLDRLVEAFVELSVPEGPDAAIQRSLVARLTSGTIELAPPAPVERTPGSSIANRWSFVLQTLATAAVVAVAATAIFTMLRRDSQPEPSAPGAQELVAVPTPASDGSIAAAAAGDDLEDLAALVSKVLKRRSELAKSESWRQAHARLSSALDRPEVIGLGFGLLGTFPWANYARF
jgi:hypothetical protein